MSEDGTMATELTAPEGPPRPRRSRQGQLLGRIGAIGGRRLRFVLIQLFGAILITFLLVRLVPGDPARALAGGGASQETVQHIREQLHLNDSLPVQFWTYLTNLVQGNLGESTSTGNAVLNDLVERAPATIELITYAMLVSLLVAVPLGILLARSKRRIAKGFVQGYALLGGAIPDFWLALLLIYLLCYGVGIFPAPVGRIGFLPPPPKVTGFYTFDSLVNGEFGTLWDSLKYLALPVITLVLVYSGQIVKVARSSVAQADREGFVDLYSGAGVSTRLTHRRAVRLAMPQVLTISGITYGYLLGGAVLVEQVFSWGGLGQYAVQAIKSSDYAAVQGFVLFAALFNVIVYLIVDLLIMVVDPRFARRR
jgi:ABC-type dipeptide/oligopeptide/nickel transport system permease component